MANIFFNTNSRKVVSASEVQAFAYEGYLNDNEYLAECFMDEMDTESMHKTILDLFNGKETVEDIRKRVANEEADSYVEDCEDDLIDLFRPIASISAEALTLIEEEQADLEEEAEEVTEEADNEG